MTTGRAAQMEALLAALPGIVDAADPEAVCSEWVSDHHVDGPHVDATRAISVTLADPDAAGRVREALRAGGAAIDREDRAVLIAATGVGEVVVTLHPTVFAACTVIAEWAVTQPSSWMETVSDRRLREVVGHVYNRWLTEGTLGDHRVELYADRRVVELLAVLLADHIADGRGLAHERRVPRGEMTPALEGAMAITGRRMLEACKREFARDDRAQARAASITPPAKRPPATGRAPER